VRVTASTNFRQELAGTHMHKHTDMPRLVFVRFLIFYRIFNIFGSCYENSREVNLSLLIYEHCTI